jgi:3-oxoisoapionate decarboxylase
MNMKLGISSYTYPWAIGLTGTMPSQPLKPLQLLEKAQELGVGLVQFGLNMPLDQLPEKELKEVVKRASSWKIDLEIATAGIEPRQLQRQIDFAKRIDVILLKTTPERADGSIPMRAEMADSLRAVLDQLAEEKIRLAIDNSRVPAQELNELIDPLHSLWVGVALDTAKPMSIPQGWRFTVRVLAHRTMCVHIKDFVVQPAPYGMGLDMRGCPVGNGQLNIPWLVESFAALRIVPSAILELWTPGQKTLEETIALEHAWAKQSVDYLRRFIPD